MSYYDHPTYQHLLAAIRSQPADDLPRLVAADFLEENGEPERAEFVRVQCDPLYTVPCGQVAFPLAGVPGQEAHAGIGLECTTLLIGKEAVEPSWCPQCQLRHRAAQLLCARDTDTERHTPHQFTGIGRTAYTVLQYDRGFVSRVRAPLAVLCGGECGRCGGRGYDRLPLRCPDCHGTGHTPGVLRELLRREPLGPEGVEVSDREPWEHVVRFSWWVEDVSEVGTPMEPSCLPLAVHDRLTGYAPPVSISGVSRSYPTESAARLALSRAVYAMCSGITSAPATSQPSPPARRST